MRNDRGGRGQQGNDRRGWQEGLEEMTIETGQEGVKQRGGETQKDGGRDRERVTEEKEKGWGLGKRDRRMEGGKGGSARAGERERRASVVQLISAEEGIHARQCNLIQQQRDLTQPLFPAAQVISPRTRARRRQGVPGE